MVTNKPQLQHPGRRLALRHLTLIDAIAREGMRHPKTLQVAEAVLVQALDIPLPTSRLAVPPAAMRA